MTNYFNVGGIMGEKLLSLGVFTLIFVFFMTVFPAFGQTEDKDRANIDEKYKWNLADIYPSVEAWQQDKEKLVERFKKISEFKGQLSLSGSKLKKALETIYQIQKEFTKAYIYAARLSDQDTRESNPQRMKQEMQQLETEFLKVSAYIDPEILSIPQEQMDSMFKEEPGLETFRQVIGEIQRSRDHILSEEQEMIIAEAGRMSGTAQSIFSIFYNADLPYPTISLSDGREVRLDPAGYAGNRANPNREDRIKVFNEFFGTLTNFQRTFGTQLYGEIKKNVFYKNVRKYESCLQSALDGNNIPTSVYHKLIENTNKNLATFHRYLRLRKRMLGVDELHYYDMYPSLVKEVNLAYTYEEAGEIIKKSLEVLGSEYVATVDRAIKERWIDVYPNTGKRSGAYSSGGAYDVHPYILMNYNDQYNDMSTLTHELGHTMHSYFSNKQQQFHNADYPIFLAEVASTGNEAILIDHMLKTIDDKEEQLALLGNYLDGFKGTLFRQTQFAEFELKIHELTEKGEALTGDKFSEIYLDILKKYYGHEEGVMVIDDQFAIEWAYIPHFYLNFYVFQYSTSFMAAQALAEKMLSGDSGMVDKYLDFLSSGGSDYAIPTLKKVGIDMTTDEPFTLAMKKMNKVMDDMEKILTDLGR
jgi:oligoendopeptidase F